MKIYLLLMTLGVLLSAFTTQAQVAINQDGTDADASSILDVKNSAGTHVFYIEDATGNVAVHNTTPAGADVFSSYATGTNWAINGYGVDAPAVFGTTSGTGEGVYGTSTGTGVGVLGIVNNSGSFGVWAQNSNASGWGVMAVGSSVGTAYTLQDHSAGIATNGNDGMFALGQASDGTGVIAAGNDAGTIYLLTDGSGGAFTGEETGVYGIATTTTTTGFGGYFEDDNSYAYVGGWYWNGLTWRDFKILGSGDVSTIVESVKGDLLTMTCPETPEVLFQDYGIGKLVNGKTHITIDPDLARNINVDKEHPLKVFVTLEGDCNGVYVTNKSANGFDVVELQGGKSNVAFSWQIVATRANKKVRLKDGSIRVADYSQRFRPAPKALESKKVSSKPIEIQKVEK